MTPDGAASPAEETDSASLADATDRTAGRSAAAPTLQEITMAQSEEHSHDADTHDADTREVEAHDAGGHEAPTEDTADDQGVPAEGTAYSAESRSDTATAGHTGTTEIITPAAPSVPPTSSGRAGSSVETAARRPRVRAGAIVWGLLVAGFAALVLVVASSRDATTAFRSWQASLTPTGWLVIGVVALGVAVLLIAGVSAIRGAQRRARSPR